MSALLPDSQRCGPLADTEIGVIEVGDKVGPDPQQEGQGVGRVDLRRRCTTWGWCSC